VVEKWPFIGVGFLSLWSNYEVELAAEHLVRRLPETAPMAIRCPFFASNRHSIQQVGRASDPDGDDWDSDDWEEDLPPDEGEPPENGAPWEDWDPLDDEPAEPAPGDFWPDDTERED
jgi:hypothetical protein